MTVNINFLVSNSDVTKCPKDNFHEFAFIGRSNVGKSSLINSLANNKKIAKISSTPGKTKLINHFTINKKAYIVDLPGYGYAKMSKSSKNELTKIINSYFIKRFNIITEVFVLVDINIPPQKIDLDFINWLGTFQIPFSIIFTKCDKISKSKLNINIENYKEKIYENWEELPKIFTFSIKKEENREYLLSYIKGYLNE